MATVVFCVGLLSCRESIVDPADARMERLLWGEWRFVTETNDTTTALALSFYDDNTVYISNTYQHVHRDYRYYVESRYLYLEELPEPAPGDPPLSYYIDRLTKTSLVLRFRLGERRFVRFQ
jgi:hypothetical protein